MSEQSRTTEGFAESRWLFDQGPYHDPPYDSPIEDQLAYHIVKYLKKDAEFVPQYEVRTFCATYRLDFRLAHQNSVIGIECDGAKYHDRDKDRIQDTLILGSGAVHTFSA